MDHAEVYINGLLPPDPIREDEVIDQVLRLVADQHRALGTLIGRAGFSPSIKELRASPLGRALRTMVQGHLTAAEVESLTEQLREVLLRPAAAEGGPIPGWFWRTEIGRLVAEAERRAIGRQDLLGMAEAAIALHISESELRRLTTTGVVPCLPDDLGEPLVRRSTIERLRQLTHVREADAADGITRMTA